MPRALLLGESNSLLLRIPTNKYQSIHSKKQTVLQQKTLYALVIMPEIAYTTYLYQTFRIVHYKHFQELNQFSGL